MSVRTNTSRIVIHCSATPPSLDIGAKEIDSWHRDKGWAGIGYHEVIRRDGRIEMGRDYSQIGAHAKGFNHESLGIVMVGGVSEDNKAESNYTPEQWRSLQITVKHKALLYPGVEFNGHRDLSPDVDGDGVIGPKDWLKMCPCFDVDLFIKEIGL